MVNCRNLGVAVAAALLLACGGGSSQTGPNPPPPPPPPPPPGASFTILGGGNNVTERYSSDLTVHSGYAYTGTWGHRTTAGNAVKVWNVQGPAPVLVDSIIVPDISTVSDLEVSSDGAVLMFSTEGGSGNGLYLYGLTDPAHPSLIASYPVGSGIHTASFGYVGGRRYAFAARDPAGPALMIFAIDETQSSPITLLDTVPIPANYGIHDTFVRDGIAFVFAWNTGVIIYDVGNGMRGGSPSGPVEISRFLPSDNGVPGGPAVHNGWWFHDPVSGENRYLFLGQEGPGTIGSASSGDIHVLDISDLTAPKEVAFYHRADAGTHNFWMDEQKQILYAAYYNAGVVGLDVSGTLSGDLAQREIAQLAEGGPGNTFTWGVQLYNGSLYAIDMLTGLWRLSGL